MKDAIEKQIRDLVATEAITARSLSNALFGPMGLFGKLAPTEQERWVMIQTPLFQQAQARVTELQLIEHEESQKELERKGKARSAATSTNRPPAPANSAPAEMTTRSDVPS